MPRSFPVFPTIICIIGVCVLCALGTWQIQRLHWKNNLQAELDTAFANTPAPLNLDKMKRNDIRRGIIFGIPDLSKAIILHGKVYDGKAMQSLVAPFQTTDGKIIPLEIGCGEHIMIDDFVTIKAHEPLQVTGVARLPTWSHFTPENIPDKGQWWRADTTEMAKYWHYPTVENIILTQENIFLAGQNLQACPIPKTLRNDHLPYAIFWFTMAGVLVVIYALRFLKKQN